MPEIVDKGQQLDLTIRQGATFGPIACTFKDELDAPIDITGYTVRAQLRKTYNGRKTLGATAVCVLTDPTNGVFTFEFLAADTAKLSVGADEDDPDSSYVWDLELEQPDTRVIPMMYGDVKVFREVTKEV